MSKNRNPVLRIEVRIGTGTGPSTTNTLALLLTASISGRRTKKNRFPDSAFSEVAAASQSRLKSRFQLVLGNRRNVSSGRSNALLTDETMNSIRKQRHMRKPNEYQK